ncbi:DUF6220 domain-containing protein [Actinoplanes sp. NPDC049599]|uniref:DUF6220 domain-containing protein n=1 Tax=Actinoplanes sp. NPDC049599 TaxID=3363903 RepID=UPI003791E956
MRKAFTGLAAALMLAIVVQFFLAASGAFDTASTEEAFRPHRMLGLGTVLLAVLLTVAGAVARLPGRLIGRAGLVAGLGVLQPVIVVVAKAFGDAGQSTTAGQLVFGLHAVNGLMMMAVVRTVLQESRAATGSPRSVS